MKNLRQQGHEVVAASPSSGVNSVTGEGLAAALVGAQVVVDVANAPSWEDKAVLEFFETSGRNLLAAEAAAGVGRRNRPPARQWLLPRENGPGESDQGLAGSIHDRPRHAVLRVRRQHRPIGNQGADGSVTASACASPSPVTVLTPNDGDAATTSWPC